MDNLLFHKQIQFENTLFNFETMYDSSMWRGIEFMVSETYDRFVQVGVNLPKNDADRIYSSSSPATQTPIQRLNFEYINSTFEGQETLTGFLACLRSSIDEQEQHFSHLNNFSTKYICHIEYVIVRRIMISNRL